MKLEIMGFSQQGLMKLGLDNDDAVLLRWFVDYQGSQRMKAIPNPEDGKVFFWVNFKKLCEDLPIITQSDRWMARRFDKLVTSGVLAKYSAVGPMGKFSAFRIGDGDEYMSLIEAMSLNTEAMSVKSDMGDVNSDMAMSPATDMQSNLNRLPSNNNTGDSQQGDKPACAGAHARAAEKTDIEEFLSGNKDLKAAFEAFKDMRRRIRKPMTDYAQSLLINRLKKLSSDSNDQIAILNQSIENSWQSIYPLHQDGQKTSGKPVRTPVSNAAFENQQGGELVW